MLHIKDALIGVMSERQECDGSLRSVLTKMCGWQTKDVLVNMIEQMSAHLGEDIIATMIDDYYERLGTAGMARVLIDSIPQDIDVNGTHDQHIFGTPEQCDIMAQILTTVSNQYHDSVDNSDAMVAAEMLNDPLFRPVFVNMILAMYQKWSALWKQENPETRGSDSGGSPRSRSPDLSSLYRHPSESASRQSSRAPSRAPSGAPSRPPSRDGHARRSSNLSSLLYQMKMMHAITK